MHAVIDAASSEDRAALSGIESASRFLENEFLVARNGLQVAAFLAWRRVAPDQWEILQLETLALFRRKGLARRLVRHLKKQVAGDLFLEVRESNAPACKLYASEGFTVAGTRREYYSYPVEDALVLRFRSC